MTRDDQIFDFELDFAGTLHCIPMIVRFKLDQCGIKLSLRQWNRFDLEDRQQLIRRPCQSTSQITAWRAFLVLLISVRAGEPAKELPIDTRPQWDDCAVAPVSVNDRIADLSLPPLNAHVWAGLSQLQRFTLIKLTRGGHDNENFEPALREFGVFCAD